jgi:quinol monooxygenase YgiN
MYGLIVKMAAVAQQREELVALLVEGVERDPMPGCLSYLLARDAQNPDVVWVTEVWDSKEAHDRSLELPSVRALISEGRPLIANAVKVAETSPAGGTGLNPMPPRSSNAATCQK